jgi:hypothetical protein
MAPDSFFTAAILAGGQGRRRLTSHIQIVANDAAGFCKTGVPVTLDRIKGAGAPGLLYTARVESPTTAGQ